MPRANDKISVIVPVYNKKDYLEQCIDSILSQTYNNLELLLIDDESTDGSGEICDRYADRDRRVRVFHQKNGGPTAAVMTGLKEAVGDYCAFIDSDDYVSSDMLQKMAERLIGIKGEIVCCNYMLEKRKETIEAVASLEPGIYEGERLQQEIKEKLIGNEERTISMSRCMKLYERSVFEGNEKYYDTQIRMGDDFNLVCPAMFNSTRIVMMEKAFFYHYRYVEDSIVHRYDENMIDSVQRLAISLHKLVKDKNVPDGEKKVNREYCYMMLLVMKNELRNPHKDYAVRIRRIFMEQSVRQKLVTTPISVNIRSNRLLYLGMRHPRQPMLMILRLIMQWYDGK